MFRPQAGLLLLLLALWPAGPARACTCRPGGDLDSDVAMSAVVFRGVALVARRRDDVTTYASGFVEMAFRVEHVWWGGEADTLHVLNGGGCGMAFVPGRRYVVFAHGGRDGLWTGGCTGTQPFAEGDAITRQLDAFERLGSSDLRADTLLARLLMHLDREPPDHAWAPIQGLRQLARCPEQVVPRLMRLAGYASVAWRAEPLEALSAFPGQVPEFQDLLRATLVEPDENIRRATLRTLSALGPAATPFIPDLLRLRRTLDPRRAGPVDALLRRLGGPDYPPAGGRAVG